MNRAARSRNVKSKERRGQREIMKQQQEQEKETKSDTFTSEMVATIYNCNCSVQNEIEYDEEDGCMGIIVDKVCPECKLGKAIEVVVGSHRQDADFQCKKPGCTCTNFRVAMSVTDFFKNTNSKKMND